MEINKQAEELNNTLILNNPYEFEMLSERGIKIYFPKKGILSQSAEAKGTKINATIGIALEDDGAPMSIFDNKEIISSLSLEESVGYAPSHGVLKLRQKWKEMMYQKNPSLKSEISLPIVTTGLTHGLGMAGFMFLNPGDNIIIPDLFWENYELIFNNNYQANLFPFNTFKRNGFDTEELKQHLEAQPGTKKVVLLNFPNNPTGYTPTELEVEEISKIFKDHASKGNNLIALIDDAYFGLVYQDKIYKESIFSKLANLDERILAVKLDAATKEDYVWGFRVGFMTFGIKNGNKALYDALESKLAGAVRGTISNAPNISQNILLKAYEAPDYAKRKNDKFELLKSRYQEVRETLKEKKYEEFFTPLPFNSGYFMCVKLNPYLDTEKVRKSLIEKYSTGVISQGNLLRVAFSSVKKDNIKPLFENIYNACKDNK